MNTRRLLEQMASSTDPSVRAQGERELRRMDEAKARAKAARRRNRGRAPGKTRAERKAEEAAHWLAVKTAVWDRVTKERGGRCEWCEQACQDPHHILNGGRRRVMETTDTVAGICRDDHRLYEKADPDTLRRAWMWAVAHGFRVAQHEIEHRISKAQEARASQETER